MKKSILTILFLLTFLSCGSKKVDKTKVQNTSKIETTATDKTKIVAETNVKQEVIKTIDNKDETVTEVVIYTPIDPNKPATIVDDQGNTHLINNTVYKKERTTKKNNTITTETASTEATDKSEITKDIKNLTENYNKSDLEQVHIQRKSWSLWNLLWLLIPISLIAVFFKYRGKIWWL